LNLLDLAIQFSVRQPMIGCILTGAKNEAEVEQSYKAATTELPDSVWQKFSDLIYSSPT
jgi:aryl-alcohol dehydrogenase-like predicted oxidoreductase